jgi:uncharacterized repeat protein (TIGR01451 family)
VAAAVAAPGGTADLEVVQTAPASGFVLGTDVAYTVTVRNLGLAPATGVQLVAATTGGLSIQTVTTAVSGAALRSSSSGLTATVGSLAAGAEAVFTVTARATAASGDVSSDARVTTASVETTLANNQDLLSEYLGDPIAPVGGGDTGGGGCTMATDGRADAGLPLLLLAALLLGVARRRKAR